MGFKAAVIVLCSALLAGCAAGGAIDYLHKEYGSAERDGVVNMSDDPSYPLEYQIWVNKQKPKLVVQTSLATAGSIGIAKGLTFGAADAAPVQPVFEQAGLKYLQENKGPDCRINNPVRLADVAWEFDYDCSQSIVADAPAVKRKRPSPK